MAFTSETKLGYFDGEHFANWSNLFPIFARVVNGQVYAVGREDNPSSDRFGKVVYLSRAWMKGSIFAGNPSDADFFVDKPNQIEDPSMPGSSFNKTSDSSTVISRPDSSAPTNGPTNTNPTSNNPTTTTPTNTTTGTTTTTATGTTTSATTSLTSGNTTNTTPVVSTAKMSTTTMILIGVGVIGVIGAIMYFMNKKKKK